MIRKKWNEPKIENSLLYQQLSQEGWQGGANVFPVVKISQMATHGTPLLIIALPRTPEKFNLYIFLNSSKKCC